jgi:hypothetical protein
MAKPGSAWASQAYANSVSPLISGMESHRPTSASTLRTPLLRGSLPLWLLLVNKSTWTSMRRSHQSCARTPPKRTSARERSSIGLSVHMTYARWSLESARVATLTKTLRWLWHARSCTPLALSATPLDAARRRGRQRARVRCSRSLPSGTLGTDARRGARRPHRVGHLAAVVARGSDGARAATVAEVSLGRGGDPIPHGPGCADDPARRSEESSPSRVPRSSR